MKKKYPISISAMAVCLLLSGCLTSENPFYEDRDIIHNDHFSGEYYSDDFPISIKLTANRGEGHRYLMRLNEASIWSEYLVTLFQIRNYTYVDLVPVQESDAPNAVSSSYPQYPTLNQMLRLISHERTAHTDIKLHLLYRIEISDTAIKLWAPKKGQDPTNILAKSPKVHTRLNGDGLIIDERVSVLRSLFNEGGEGNAVFQPDPITLKKKWQP